MACGLYHYSYPDRKKVHAAARAQFLSSLRRKAR